MKSIFSKFQSGLRKTATSISRSIHGAFTGTKAWDQTTYEALEAALIGADFGVKTSLKIVEDIKTRYEQGVISTSEQIVEIAKNDIKAILDKDPRPINLRPDGLTVILLVGVNGSGKTTTAGKLAHLWRNEGKKVALAACDTFRAAAVDQLKLWADRTHSHIIAAQSGADPAAVAYDATESSLKRDMDILLVDTAGRQHTKKNLMDELAKMKRTIDKVLPGAPHEVWLTIDASLGTNVMSQTQEFTNTVGVNGLILTKMDGSGKGGMAVALREAFDAPVFFAGFGEQPDDLQPFDSSFYADALFGQ